MSSRQRREEAKKEFANDLMASLREHCSQGKPSRDPSIADLAKANLLKPAKFGLISETTYPVKTSTELAERMVRDLVGFKPSPTPQDK
jgi:hypothetical protein